MDSINAPAMRQGVQDSVAVVVLLTTGYMGRPFCQQELRWAKVRRLPLPTSSSRATFLPSTSNGLSTFKHTNVAIKITIH